MDRLSSQIVRGASGTLVVRVLSSGVLLLLAIAIGHLLGVSEFGRYSYTIVLANLLATPIAMGLDTLTTREIAAAAAQHELDRLSGILRFWKLVVLCLGAVTVCIAFLVPAGSLRYAALLAPLIATLRIQGGVLRGFRAVEWSGAPEFILVPTTVLTGVVAGQVAGVDLSSTHVIACHFGGVSVALIVNQLHIARQDLPGTRAVPRMQCKSWTLSALPMLLSGGARQLNSRVDVLMVGSFLTDQDVGMYTIAVRGAEFVVMPLLAANAALAPQFARFAALGDYGELSNIARRWARIALTFSVPIVIVLMTFAGTFFDVLGSPGPQAALLAFRILLAARLLLVAGGPTGVALTMTGNERGSAMVLAGSAALNIALNAVLLPTLGLPGAAYAYVLSVILVVGLSNVWLHRRLGFTVHILAFGHNTGPTGSLKQRPIDVPVTKGIS